jgi:hypothetical protein
MNWSNINYDGHTFHDFYVDIDGSTGPGYFIFGRNKVKYGTYPNGLGRYVMLCGYRVSKGHRYYNGKVRHGWRTKKEAQAALDAKLKACPWLLTPDTMADHTFQTLAK